MAKKDDPFAFTLNTALRAKAIDTVQKALDEAQNDREEREDDWLDYWAVYRNEYDFPQTYSFKSKIVPPVGYTMVETEMPRLHDGLFGSRPYIRALPHTEEDAKPARDMIDPLLDHQLTDLIKLPDAAYSHLKSGAIFGTTIVEMGWKDDFRKVPKRVVEEVSGQPVVKLVEEIDRVYHGPTVDNVPCMDFWIDPQVVDHVDAVQEAEFVIRRAHLPHDEVLKNVDSGFWTLPSGTSKKDLVAGETETARGSRQDFDTQRQDLVGKGERALGRNRAETFGYHEVHNYWGKFQSKDSEEVFEAVITMLDGKYIVRVQRNPYGGWRPFVAVQYIDDPTEFWGISLIESIWDLIVKHIVLYNQRQDNVNLLMSPMVAVDDSALKDPDELIYRRPGGLVRFDATMGRINELYNILPIENNVATSLQEEVALMNFQDRATGQFDYTRGEVSNNQPDTATGIVSIIGEANARFRHRIKRFGTRYLSAIADAVMRLNKMFLDDGYVVRLEGEDGLQWRQIDLDALNKSFDFRFVPAPMMGDKSIRRQEVLNLFSVLSQNPNVAPWLKTRPHLKMIYEDYELDDVNTFVKTPEELAREQQALDTQEEQALEGAQQAAEDAADSQAQREVASDVTKESMLSGIPEREKPGGESGEKSKSGKGKSSSKK